MKIKINKKTFAQKIAFTISTVIFILLAILYFVFNKDVGISLIVAVVFFISLLLILFLVESFRQENNKIIENELDITLKEIIEQDDLGVLNYDENYVITFLSSFFSKKEMNHLNEKILSWLPELQDILVGDLENKLISINDDKFLVRKVDGASTLLFKDLTKSIDLQKKLDDDSCVLGLLAIDNFDESNESEDVLTFINSNIKNLIFDYLKKFNIVYKTLKNNRIMLILNESIFEAIMADHFSILATIRKVAKEAELDVSVSMAFSRGSDDLKLLDESLQSAIELAQTRGGDQVVVKKIGADPAFFGGTSEAREKQSKTKVRIIVNSLKDLILKSSNVIIVGHKDMDADCVGAAIGVSLIASNLRKDVYLVSKTGGIEPIIHSVLNNYSKTLNEKHNFVDESDALGYLDDDSLVIMVDHHDANQSGAFEVVESAKRVVIIDHHRRKAELNVNALLVYIEPYASSTCELVVEFLPYMSRKALINTIEANIMYMSIIVDTDHFRVKTGTRTFDAAKFLKQNGADPLLCNTLLEEPFNLLKEKSAILINGKIYHENIFISAMNDGTYNRTIASKAADEIINSKGVEAAFIICDDGNEEIAIIARSKGLINVQVILEKMHGGGHMMAAGLQRKDTTVAKLESELLGVIDDYLLSLNKDEEGNDQ